MTFIVYSKDNCPYCSKVERLLSMSEQEYVIYKLDRDYDREEFYNKFGVGSTFPKVMIGEEVIGGAVDTVRYLQVNNLV
jgi:glutaredoxin 3